MLANPDYADLVQAIGVASLGADPAQIYHLTKIYWYTVEFGVVREGKEIKAFGAGMEPSKFLHTQPFSYSTCVQLIEELGCCHDAVLR